VSRRTVSQRRDVKSEAATAEVAVEATPPGFARGFAMLARRHPDLIGAAESEETYPLPGTALQKTSTGHLIWGANLHGHIGNDGTVRFWDGSQLLTVVTPEKPPVPEPEPSPEPPTPPEDAWRYWTAQQIATASGCPLAAVQQHWPTLWTALHGHHISGRLEQMAAIATVAIETASTFQPVREAFWLSEEWRRDNLRYYPHYGRGFIQLTWDYNYREYGQKLGFDLINNLDLALDPFIAAMVLARYFVDRQVADAAAAQDWPEVRRRVQGGSAGLDRLLAIVQALGSPAVSGDVFPVQGYSGAVPLHWGSHPGAADLFAPEGTPVLAFRGGVVSSAGFSQIGGNHVIITHDGSLLGYYAHGDRAPAVRTGQRIEKGTYLFGVGDTGNAVGTDPHLHIGGGPRIANGTGPAGGAGVYQDGSPYDFRALLMAALGQATVMPRFRTSETINLRSAPGTDTSVIQTLPAGTVVSATASPSYAWRRVKAPDGTPGWCANDYLEVVT
jgi:murein DD-endopeptidase MepM/ murein hydrolase activator NlpD